MGSQNIRLRDHVWHRVDVMGCNQYLYTCPICRHSPWSGVSYRGGAENELRAHIRSRHPDVTTS